MSLNVRIHTILHGLQRYKTVGDYFVDKFGTRRIHVSEMGNEDYEFLVAVHEFIEEYLTRKRGISEESIKAFDEDYEAHRDPEDITSEPGWSPLAPYWREHAFAEKIERMIAEELGVDWDRYESKVNSL